MDPREYRFLLTSVTDDKNQLTDAEAVERARLQKGEVLRVRELLKRDWRPFQGEWEAISLTIFWSDRCSLVPKPGRPDKDGVAPVEIWVPVDLMIRSLREQFYAPLVRWLMLQTISALQDRSPEGSRLPWVQAAMAELPDYELQLQECSRPGA